MKKYKEPQGISRNPNLGKQEEWMNRRTKECPENLLLELSEIYPAAKNSVYLEFDLKILSPLTSKQTVVHVPQKAITLFCSSRI